MEKKRSILKVESRKYGVKNQAQLDIDVNASIHTDVTDEAKNMIVKKASRVKFNDKVFVTEKPEPEKAPIAQLN